MEQPANDPYRTAAPSAVGAVVAAYRSKPYVWIYVFGVLLVGAAVWLLWLGPRDSGGWLVVGVFGLGGVGAIVGAGLVRSRRVELCQNGLRVHEGGKSKEATWTEIVRHEVVLDSTRRSAITGERLWLGARYVLTGERRIVVVYTIEGAKDLVAAIGERLVATHLPQARELVGESGSVDFGGVVVHRDRLVLTKTARTLQLGELRRLTATKSELVIHAGSGEWGRLPLDQVVNPELCIALVRVLVRPPTESL